MGPLDLILLEPSSRRSAIDAWLRREGLEWLTWRRKPMHI